MKISSFILLGIFTLVFIGLLWILHSSPNIYPYNYKEGLTSSSYPATLGTGIYQVYNNIYFDEANGSLIEITMTQTAGGVVPSVAPSPVAPAPELAPDVAPAPELAPDVAPPEITPSVASEIAPDVAPAPAPSTSYAIAISTVWSRDKGNKIDNAHYTINNDAGTIVSVSVSTDAVASVYDTFHVQSGQLQFFYVSWDKATFVHVIDMTVNQTQATPIHVCTFIHDKPAGLSQPIIKSYPDNANSITINTQSYTVNIADNRNTVIPSYDNRKSVRRIVEGVFYDFSNGSLLIQTANGFNVYERSGSTNCQTPAPKYIDANRDPVSGTTTSVTDVGVCAWTIVAKNFIVLYIANGKRTQLAVLNRETNAEKYNLVSVTRFMNNGTVDAGSSIPDVGSQSLDGYFKDAGSNANEHEHQHDDNPLSNYYRWVEYWNKLSGNDLYNTIASNNYMLKTQIVPPVCPRCPNCPGSGVCTSCGGQGGAGSSIAPSSSSDDKDKNRDNDGVGDFLRDTGSGVKDFAEDTGKGVKSVAYDAASGAKGVAYDVASGAKGVAYDIAGGVRDIAGGVGSGVKDVAEDVIGGVTRILTPHPTNVQNPNMGGGGQPGRNEMGTHLNGNYGYIPSGPGSQQFGIMTKTPQTTGSDYMSYFGALQPHGGAGNYMPVTADFSAFRR